ncbi:hypothetical protein D9M68_753230 [compost metagenome]
MGAINIVNAIEGGTNVKMGTALRDSALVRNFKRWSYIAGNTEFKVFPTNSPSTSYFNQTVQTKEGEWYSLFLCGTATSPEGILVKEILPSFKPEQCAIRVVNLATNGAGLNITLSGSPTVNEFSNLAYKQVTDFKTYAIPFSATAANFTFQVRNGAGTVLVTLALNATQLNGLRYDSASLVIFGQVGGTGSNALGLMYVPNY